jgi:hypothetical protein
MELLRMRAIGFMRETGKLWPAVSPAIAFVVATTG